VYAEIGDEANQSKWIYVILSNGQSQTVDPIPAGYAFSHTIKANAGFSNTGNTGLNSDNAGLNALFDGHAALGVLKYPNKFTFDDLNDMDLTGILEADFRMTKKDGLLILDMASNISAFVVVHLGVVVTHLGETVFP
jgi:hypothetical protein